MGAVASVVLGGIGSIVVVALVALLWPPLRRFGSLVDVKPIEETADSAFPGQKRTLIGAAGGLSGLRDLD
jgi:hypothetical protein